MDMDIKHPVISIIIPIFNQEMYLGKCLHSVIRQTFRDIEIILVNDGSTDNSLRICQKYAKKDNRIVIIDKKNNGVAQARKTGFLKASGEYVCFVDSDDYLTSNALAILYDLSQKKKADMVVGSYDVVYDNWGILKKKPVRYGIIDEGITEDRVLPLMLGMAHIEDMWAGYVWGRLYRRDCILKAKISDLFSETRLPYPEDTQFNLFLAPYIKSVYITSSVVYHYRYGGITNRDYPCIRNGGGFFDIRFNLCVNHKCESMLSRVFCHYSFLLMTDLLNQIHFHSNTENGIYDFVKKEISDRKIVLWAREHISEVLSESENVAFKKAIVDNNVDEIVRLAYQGDVSFQNHYRRMILVRLYMIFADKIGYLMH